MSRFVDFLVFAYAPLAARFQLVERVPAQRAASSTRARGFLAAMRTAPKRRAPFPRARVRHHHRPLPV